MKSQTKIDLLPRWLCQPLQFSEEDYTRINHSYGSFIRFHEKKLKISEKSCMISTKNEVTICF